MISTLYFSPIDTLQGGSLFINFSSFCSTDCTLILGPLPVSDQCTQAETKQSSTVASHEIQL